ncbi:hypothetical protein MATL_G00053560 [Megalops atlanticus]|uniref:Uncharacterized protein n=1 Tax=Megalops atlanticus TaxID=7932 RepID=A0A9D3QGF6_MEGAT|nr:hypothetical protein MATL_G00053560 [Megalops atlanticus]
MVSNLSANRKVSYPRPYSISDANMADGTTDTHPGRSVSRRSSGLLSQAPAHLSQEEILRESLVHLTSVTKAVTENIHNINKTLDRILQDKADVEELEAILMRFSKKLVDNCREIGGRGSHGFHGDVSKPL